MKCNVLFIYLSLIKIFFYTQHSKALSRYLSLVESSPELSKDEDSDGDAVSGYLDRCFQLEDDVREKNMLLPFDQQIESVETRNSFVKNPSIIFELIEKQVRYPCNFPSIYFLNKFILESIRRC